jgi:hypothetical protein
MMTGIAFVLVAIAGVVVGAVFHAYLKKETVATRAEVVSWAEELRSAAVADAEAGKSKIRALILKIEAKL